MQRHTETVHVNSAQSPKLYEAVRVECRGWGWKVEGGRWWVGRSWTRYKTGGKGAGWNSVDSNFVFLAIKQSSNSDVTDT